MPDVTVRLAVGLAGIITALVVWQLAASVGPLAESPLPSAAASVGEGFGRIG